MAGRRLQECLRLRWFPLVLGAWLCLGWAQGSWGQEATNCKKWSCLKSPAYPPWIGCEYLKPKSPMYPPWLNCPCTKAHAPSGPPWLGCRWHDDKGPYGPPWLRMKKCQDDCPSFVE